MKRITLHLVFFLVAAGLMAQTSDKKFGIGVAPGVYGGVNNTSIGFMPEFYFSAYLSPKLDLMLREDLGLFNSDITNKLDLANTSLNLRYKLSDESKNFRPYLYAGPGYLADNSTSGVNFNAGLGAKYYLSSSTALYADAGYINGIEYTRPSTTITKRDNFFKVTIGLEYDFGKAKDADLDGVSDKKDKCPETPAGVAVDADGCPIDSDGDGVADYQDDCPTVAGLAALKGCPDKDGDGIADKDDDCPDVAGIKALKGCPDTDGDGVADANDKCPETPKGWKVDKAGCPIDTDGDGIVDAEDACPTVAGVKEEKGCPKKEEPKRTPVQITEKIEPVYFAVDKSYVTDYSKGKLNKLITLLNNNQEYLVEVYGHTDDTADEDYNMKLSQQRIDEVITYLTSKGIAKDRIFKTKAYGESMPADTNATAEGKQKNRRVEFQITVYEK